MPTGRVKWFNDARGFGFITDDEGADLFVHYTGIAGRGRRSLAANARVTFEARQGKKGMEAFDVRPIGAPVRAEPAEKSAAASHRRLSLPRPMKMKRRSG
jgi:CspA family cold shock protein